MLFIYKRFAQKKVNISRYFSTLPPSGPSNIKVCPRVFSVGHMAVPRALFRMAIHDLLKEDSVAIVERSWIHRVDNHLSERKVWGQQFFFNLTHEWQAFLKLTEPAIFNQFPKVMQAQIKDTFHKVKANENFEKINYEEAVVTIKRLRDADELFKEHIKRKGLFRLIEVDQIIDATSEDGNLTVRGMTVNNVEKVVFSGKISNYSVYIDGLKRENKINVLSEFEYESHLLLMELPAKERKKLRVIIGGGQSAYWAGESPDEGSQTKYVVYEKMKKINEGRNSVINIPEADQFLADSIDLIHFSLLGNDRLSIARRENVAKYLQSHNVDREKLNDRTFQIIFENTSPHIIGMGYAFNATGYSPRLLFPGVVDKKLQSCHNNPAVISSIDLPPGHHGLTIGHIARKISKIARIEDLEANMKLIPFENGSISEEDMPTLINYMKNKNIIVEPTFFKMLQNQVKGIIVSNHLLEYKKAFISSSNLTNKVEMADRFIKEIDKIEKDTKLKIEDSIAVISKQSKVKCA